MAGVKFMMTLPKTLHKVLAKQAIEEDCTIQEIVRELLYYRYGDRSFLPKRKTLTLNIKTPKGPCIRRWPQHIGLYDIVSMVKREMRLEEDKQYTLFRDGSPLNWYTLVGEPQFFQDEELVLAEQPKDYWDA